MLAYVREYSTLSTYTDTVFLFREKMADYMLTPDKKVRFKGWSSPRLLACRSYYRFTDARGRDSVSNVSNHHFSWSDWIGTPPASVLPHVLAQSESGSDTIRGKYSATEMWTRNNSRVIVDVDVMADTTSRKWVPNLAGFFRNDLEFERFRVRFNMTMWRAIRWLLPISQDTPTISSPTAGGTICSCSTVSTNRFS